MGERYIRRLDTSTKTKDSVYLFQIRAQRKDWKWGDYGPSPPVRVVMDQAPDIPAPGQDYGEVEAWPFYRLNAIVVFWTPVFRRDLRGYRVYRTLHSNKNAVKKVEDYPDEDGFTNDCISFTLGLFHIDAAWDKMGRAQAGSTGQTLKGAGFKDSMLWEMAINRTTGELGMIIDVVDSETITTFSSVSWSVTDKYTIDKAPWKNQQYYYWVSSVDRDDNEGPLSECDGAMLGKPNDPVFSTTAIEDVDAPDYSQNTGHLRYGEEDSTLGFMFIKAWTIKWTCTGGAEFYWVRRKRVQSGAWTLPILVHHDGAPDDEQEHSFRNLIVGFNYQFDIKAGNTLGAKDTVTDWLSGWSLTSPTVTGPIARQLIFDSTAPEIPRNVGVREWAFGSTMVEWERPNIALPQNQDISHFNIYRRRDGDPEDAEHRKLRATRPATKRSHYLDFRAGEGDTVKWHYYVSSEDWHGNESSLAMVSEGDFTKKVIVFRANLVLGVLLWWRPNEAAEYFKIYRRDRDNNWGIGEEPTDDDLLCADWRGNIFYNFRQQQEHNEDILKDFKVGSGYYYKVIAVSYAGTDSLSSPSIDGEGQVIDLPELPSIPHSKIESEGWIRTAIDIKISVADLDGDGMSGINIRPAGIALQSTGNITIAAGQAINLQSPIGSTAGAKINIASGGDIFFDSGAIYSNSDYIWISPNAPYANTLMLQAWDTIRVRANKTQLWSRDQVSLTLQNRSIELRTQSGVDDSQIYMWLPDAWMGGGVKTKYRLFRDPDGNVKAIR